MFSTKTKGKEFFLDPEVIARKKKNREEFIEAIDSDNTGKLLAFIAKPEKLEDIHVNDAFIEVALKANTVRKEFLEVFLKNKVLKKHINFNYVYECFVDNNNLKLIQEFDGFIKKTEEVIENYLLISTQNNNLETLKFLIEINNVKKEMLYSSLFKASALNNINIVQYLLEEQHLDIHSQYNLVLRNAGSNKNIDLVKYLLTSTNLKEKANPYALQDDLIITAIMTKNTVLLNYLYDEYKIKESDKVKEYKESKLQQYN